MTEDLVGPALAVNRVVGYLGYVLLAGTLVFWATVRPRSQARSMRPGALGAALLGLATVAGPAIQVGLGGQLLGDTVSAVSGTADLVRLAALVAAVFFLPDLVGGDLVGARRVGAMVIALVLTATVVAVSADAHQSWSVLAIGATAVHVLLAALWLGGLVVLASMLVRRVALAELGSLLPRFSAVTTVSLVGLTVTGAVQAVVHAGGPDSWLASGYGLALLVKVGLFAALLVVGLYGRRFATRVAFRASYVSGEQDLAGSHAVHTLTVVIVVELAVAVLILAATSALVGTR